MNPRRWLLAAAVFAVALSSSCAHVQPIAGDVVTCFGKDVSASDVQRIQADLSPPPNYTDLAIECASLGWAVGSCVIDDLSSKHPGLTPAGAEFKRQHAVEIRSSQQTSMSTPARRPNPVAEGLEACDLACGAPRTGLPVEGGRSCICWHKATRSDRGHWAALERRAPPGEGGLGMAGGGGG